MLIQVQATIVAPQCIAALSLDKKDGGHVRGRDGDVPAFGGASGSNGVPSLGNADQSLWKWFRKGHRPQDEAGEDGLTADCQSGGKRLPPPLPS